MKASRREFIKKSIMAMSAISLYTLFFNETLAFSKVTERADCTLYRAVNGTPDKNLIKIIELIGGIQKIIGADDVVVIKPNLQWWNHGATNLSALKSLVDLIMNYPGGFYGEVVIAENCHRGTMPWNSSHSGWASRFKWNSDLQEINNMNDLSVHLKQCYGKKFSTCHWIDVSEGTKRVNGPEDGTGYVYCDGTGGVPLISIDNGANGNDFRAVIMSYPIFQTDKGTVVDFKNGIWENGTYTEKPLRFINVAALNHHSTYCGITSAIKNFLGISDLSGGPDPHADGCLTGNFYNFHSFPFNKWAPGPVAGMLGSEIGFFMNSIRKADLNITTAEWIGIVSRTESPIVNVHAVLGCKDPVALDYHAAKYILYPNSRIAIHDPDNIESPTHQYLVKCSEQGGGIFNERYVDVKSYDFATNAFQDDSNLIVVGRKRWDLSLKNFMKYMTLKYFH
jgi:hypothetical protein